jgi:hypothetical protein
MHAHSCNAVPHAAGAPPPTRSEDQRNGAAGDGTGLRAGTAVGCGRGTEILLTRLLDIRNIFPLNETSILGLRMDPDRVVLDLLTIETRNGRATLCWHERRSSSWADAAMEAAVRAASDGSQIRGQLRYHLGEVALAQAARSGGAGAIPLATKPPGGVFTVARVGRFGLVSVMIHDHRQMPRRTVTRKLLSQPNESLDPQSSLPFADPAPKPITDLAYFGCLIAVAGRRDPTVPAELALAVPTAALDRWISWIPLHRLHALLQERADRGPDDVSDGGVPDIAFPMFRVPGDRKDSGDD